MSYGALILINFASILFLVEFEGVLALGKKPSFLDVLLLRHGRKERWLKFYLVLLVLIALMASTRAARSYEAPLLVCLLVLAVNACIWAFVHLRHKDKR